ncbi:hypothetical protein EXIGLDRAFT_792224 [Exidia glandulosa HHB12029]|uniref:DUF6535 domain-containing protein n=1 Tax=Exidia glandulosa HHB12029 TaxID=1314781 RepID=A0A165H488_EXIGL|nr:hypothetical protein EXIGLDRAFT_792224 [Exidia glandulosa HHB12029]
MSEASNPCGQGDAARLDATPHLCGKAMSAAIQLLTSNHHHGASHCTLGVPALTSAAAQEPAKGGLRPPVADTDFKEKYPPDRELGHELDDTARVWKVYRGEAIDHDDALLKTWNETVNILLTFAGLFSAAVTSFVAASTDDLKPDPNAYVANLLFTMGNATAGASPFAHLPPPPSLDAAPTSLARVVNGFWYTSLFLSLAAALLCILVKQWLDEYTARTRGSAKHPRQWAQRRSFYFQGLNDWHVAAIISFLPLFLHLALFLFLAGLTAFLWDLDSAIRWVMLALMSVLLAVYLVSLFLPVWSAACPSSSCLNSEHVDLSSEYSKSSTGDFRPVLTVCL